MRRSNPFLLFSQMHSAKKDQRGKLRIWLTQLSDFRNRKTRIKPSVQQPSIRMQIPHYLSLHKRQARMHFRLHGASNQSAYHCCFPIHIMVNLYLVLRVRLIDNVDKAARVWHYNDNTTKTTTTTMAATTGAGKLSASAADRCQPLNWRFYPEDFSCCCCCSSRMFVLKARLLVNNIVSRLSPVFVPAIALHILIDKDKGSLWDSQDVHCPLLGTTVLYLRFKQSVRALPGLLQSCIERFSNFIVELSRKSDFAIVDNSLHFCGYLACASATNNGLHNACNYSSPGTMSVNANRHA